MESEQRDLRQTLERTILTNRNRKLKTQSCHMRFGYDFSHIIAIIVILLLIIIVIITVVYEALQTSGPCS